MSFVLRCYESVVVAVSPLVTGAIVLVLDLVVSMYDWIWVYEAEIWVYVTGIWVYVSVTCLQTKDLKCATRLLNEKFEMMSEPKKAIELANSFNLDKNKLDTSYGSFKVKPKIIGTALGLNASDLFPDKVSYKKLSEKNKLIFRRFQGKTLKNLIDEMMNISVDNDHDRLMFKRIFILYIQMAFLLPITINKVSPVHLTPIFQMNKIMEGNWGGHVLNFIIKGITITI
ncbi:hypothetical protein Ahy_Scaffold6g107910 [Arachis hypogaea]|uniref:Uncharacterized protein n=1 Tax=Arachis hypogaea TaxID=3818 RepID=A0A444WNV9_ARAHY|nr:hypothetical protein Ahy_Scaffold6g107910 [Arachis hypogaea]